TAQVGAAIGLAVLATISANKTDALLAAGDPRREALTGGYEIAFWVAVGLVVAALAVAFIVLEPAPAREVGEDPGEVTELELETEPGTG
ncbi:MAG TPA: hypothetical protein P5138_07080, partial [Solirubrobacterales bacterium]|nr:hypothetical protein [Solirubrobacterales bacterium]